MKMNRKEKIELAERMEDNNRVTIRDVTSGMNGYPEPFKGFAVLPYDMETLNELAEELECEIHEFHWKNGWHNCKEKNGWFSPEEYTSHIIEFFENQDNMEVIYVGNFDKEEWIKEKRELYEDEWSDYQSEINKTADEIESLKHDNCEAVIMSVSETENYIYNNSIHYSYDADNYHLGVFIETE